MEQNQQVGPQAGPPGGPQPAQPMGPQASQISAAKQAAQAVAPEEDLGPEALQVGKSGDNAKFLIGAIQNLHNYISSLTDAKVQGMVRNLIGVITRLVEHDQEFAANQLADEMQGQENGGAEEAQIPGALGGGLQGGPGGGPQLGEGNENLTLGGGQIKIPAPPTLD